MQLKILLFIGVAPHGGGSNLDGQLLLQP